MRKYVLLTALLFVAACAEEEAAGPVYDTAGVERRTIEVAVSSAGIVEPLATVEVKSKASGEVLDLFVATGDKVEEGTLMVAIDPRTVRNRLAQSDAELKAALSRREIALTQKARVELLVKAGTLTQSDLEQAVLGAVERVVGGGLGAKRRTTCSGVTRGVDSADLRLSETSFITSPT